MNESAAHDDGSRESQQQNTERKIVENKGFLK